MYKKKERGLKGGWCNQRSNGRSIQVPSKNEHFIEEKEDKPNELNRVEEELARVLFALKKSTINKEPKFCTYKMVIEENQVKDHFEGWSIAQINKKECIDEKKLLKRK